MRNGTRTTALALTATGAAVALLTACGGGHSSAGPPPSPTAAVPSAPAVHTPDLPGASADCRAMAALVPVNTAALEAKDSMKLLGVALLADKDARTMKDDKFAIATRGLATYDREEAAHLKDPVGNPAPQVSLMTSFTTVFETCATP